jgi:hypothetical protein
LSKGKAPGADGILAEHLIYSHPCVAIHLAILFNAMFEYQLVPQDFTNGILIPIFKQEKGDKSKVANYRGITISCQISKIFEKVLITKLNNSLNTSDLQFAFKSNIGCPDAILAARSVIDHYTQGGSTVNICALDLSMAFDKIIFSKLFLTLMDRKVPKPLIVILQYWYFNSSVMVRWGNCLSRSFRVKSGVRQGGLLSPSLFAVYIDVLIVTLEKDNRGCFIDGNFIGVLVYADDILLLSSSFTHLQLMLKECNSILLKLGMSINVGKSQFMRCGKHHNAPCAVLQIAGITIERVASLKYLGVTFLSDRSLMTDYDCKKATFYRSFNAVYNKSKNAEAETISVTLLQSICLPSMLYAIEALSPKHSVLTSLDNIITRCFGRIFHTYDSLILNDCRLYLNVRPISIEYYSRTCKFALAVAAKNYWFAYRSITFLLDNLRKSLPSDWKSLLPDNSVDSIHAVIAHCNRWRVSE